MPPRPLSPQFSKFPKCPVGGGTTPAENHCSMRKKFYDLPFLSRPRFWTCLRKAALIHQNGARQPTIYTKWENKRTGMFLLMSSFRIISKRASRVKITATQCSDKLKSSFRHTDFQLLWECGQMSKVERLLLVLD